MSLDGAQIRCRPTHRREDNLDKAQKALERCLSRRQDLDQGQRDGLGALLQVIKKNPRVAFEEIGNFRRSFIAPVPGQFGERIGHEYGFDAIKTSYAVAVGVPMMGRDPSAYS